MAIVNNVIVIEYKISKKFLIEFDESAVNGCPMTAMVVLLKPKANRNPSGLILPRIFGLYISTCAYCSRNSRDLFDLCFQLLACRG